MVAPLHADTEQQRGWFPAWLGLWSLCWRLSVLLVFFMGICASILLDHWWAALACVVGFVVAAFIVRRQHRFLVTACRSTPEMLPHKPSNQSMKPTAPSRYTFSAFATSTCRGLSLSRSADRCLFGSGA